MFASYRLLRLDQVRQRLQKGEWFDALAELNSSKEVRDRMFHAYQGMAQYYQGDFNSASGSFRNAELREFQATAELELHFPDVCKMRKSISGVLGTSTNRTSEEHVSPWCSIYMDPEARLSDDPFAEGYRNCVLTPTVVLLRAIPGPKSFSEKHAFAQITQIVASRTFEVPSTALQAAEELKRSGPEGSALAPWFIGHSLLLHGKLAERQGNALLAEGLYDAAREQAESLMNLKRKDLLVHRSSKAKGQLLLKWENRDIQGSRILEGLDKVDIHAAADASEVFLPAPSLEAIELAVS